MGRLTLLISIGLFFLFGAVYRVFIHRDIQFRELSVGPVTTMAPAGWSTKQSRQRGWEIIRFRDGASWLALAYYADKDAGPDFLEDLHSGIKGFALRFPLRSRGDGYYYLFARGKNRRRFLAIFTHRGVPWWIESGTHRSTHRIYKEVLDRALLHLRIDGDAVDGDLSRGVEAIDKQVGIWYVQGERFWLAFMAAPSFLILGLMVLITKLSSRPVKADRFAQETITRQAAGTDVSIRGRGGYKLHSCSLYLTDARLVAFGFFRPILDLGHQQDEEVEVTSATSRFFGMPYLQVDRRKGARITYRFFLHDADAWAVELSDRRRGDRQGRLQGMTE